MPLLPFDFAYGSEVLDLLLESLQNKLLLRADQALKQCGV